MLSDLRVVAFEDFYGVSPLLEAAVEGALPDDLVRQVESPGPAENEEADERVADAVEGMAGDDHAQLVDGVAHALVPASGIADAQDHPGVGMALHQLLVERAGRPVHGRLIFPEDPFPVRRLPSPGGDPEPRVLGVREDLGHVVAGIEAELFERDLQRHGARPAEAGADDLHLVISWRCSPRTARAASASGTCRSRSSGSTRRTRRRRAARIWRSPLRGGPAGRPPSRSRPL